MFTFVQQVSAKAPSGTPALRVRDFGVCTRLQHLQHAGFAKDFEPPVLKSQEQTCDGSSKNPLGTPSCENRMGL